MVMKNSISYTTAIFMALCFIVLAGHAQSIGDYRTINSGAWSSVAIWQRYDITNNWVAALTAPTDADGVITIRSPHSITINTAVSANQIVIDAGATLANNANLTLPDASGDELIINGTFTHSFEVLGTGTILCNNIWNWGGGGALRVNATVSNTGILTISNSKTLNATITNNGTCNWNAGANITCDNSGFVNNGTFIATGNNSWAVPTGTNIFNNTASGVFRKQTGTGVTAIGIPFTNAGLIQLLNGTLRQSASTLTNTGTVDFVASTILECNNAAIIFNSGTNITGTSTYENRVSGTTTFNTSVIFSNGTFTTGTVDGTGSLAFSNTWKWENTGVNLPITIQSGATATFDVNGKTLRSTLTNNGTINWTDGVSFGSITLNNGTIINNNVINENFTTGDRGVLTSGGTNSFTNNGTILKQSNRILTIAVPFTNSVTGIMQGSGTFNATGTVSNAGTIAPGNSIGLLTVSPSLVVGTPVTIQIEIQDASGEGTGNDVLTLSGSTSLTGVDIQVLAAPAVPPGFYTIMRTSTGLFSSYFASVDQPPTNFADPVVQSPASSINIQCLWLLPVVWGKVSAKIAANGVQVNWETLSETNTAKFEVEHSLDGAVFNTVGLKPAAGNSASSTKYQFLHTTPSASTHNHYRIKQIDKDGKTNYSIVAAVGSATVAGTSPFLIVNPVHHSLNIKVQANSGTILVSNSAGQLMLQRKALQGNLSFDVGSWPSGVYYVQFRDDSGSVKSEKFIKN